MNRSVKYNIVRYVISIIVPLCFIYTPYIALVVAFLLLVLNNVLDDVSFYYASKEVDGKQMSSQGSPVNGIITDIEYGVPLFSHIRKSDVLTNGDCLEIDKLQNNYDKVDCRWNHITIFLNKFSHHIIVNPTRVKSMKRLFADGRLEEMIVSGRLLPNANGEYRGNQAVIIEYTNMYAVLTLDKYVSRYIAVSRKQGEVGISILRGSQCDIYTKAAIDSSLKVGDVVQIG